MKKGGGGLNRFLDGITEVYSHDLRLKRKARYTTLFMTLLMFYVIPGFVIDVVSGGILPSMIFTYGAYYAVIAFLFRVLKKGHLHTVTNVLLAAGFVKAAEFFIEPAGYQFYVHIMEILIICGAVYVYRYQLYIGYIVSNLAIIARPFLVSRQIEQGLVSEASLPASIHAIIGGVIVTLTVHYLTGIIEREIAEAKKLDELATTDPLTGMGNRRKLQRSMPPDGITDRVLLMMDLDRFKDVNDKFGHERGDKVLVAFAAGLRRSLRDGDASYRWGGEEFIAVLDNADEQTGLVIADRIRRRCEEMDLGVDHRITVSIGLTLGQPGDDLDSMIRRADVALYKAKAAGRNRVESY